MLTLYDRTRSGNYFRARLMLGLLGLEYERVPIATGGGATIFHGKADLGLPDHPDQQALDERAGAPSNRSEWFLKLSPRGHVPVLVDGDHVVWDSSAIVVYLARKYGGTSWLPNDESEAYVQQWITLSQNELLYGLAQCRGIMNLGRPGNLEACRSLGRMGLDAMAARLADHEWLALDRPTIGDVCCFPYVALSPSLGIPLDGAYSVIARWVRRVEAPSGLRAALRVVSNAHSWRHRRPRRSTAP